MSSYQSPWIDDELRIVRATLKKFMQEELVPQQARWRQQHCPDAAAWTASGALGMLLPPLRVADLLPA